MQIRDLRPIVHISRTDRRPDERSMRSLLGTSSPRPDLRPLTRSRPDGHRAERPARVRVRSGDARRLAGRRPAQSRPAATERAPGCARSTPLRERDVRGDVALDVVHDAIGHCDRFPPTTGRRNGASRSSVDGRQASLVRPATPVGAPAVGTQRRSGIAANAAAGSVNRNARCNRHSQPMRPYPVAACRVAVSPGGGDQHDGPRASSNA